MTRQMCNSKLKSSALSFTLRLHALQASLFATIATGSARGNWDLREGQQPFRPNPNGFGDRTTPLSGCRLVQRLASNLSSSTATDPDKVAYPMLKHLPLSGMDFLLHIFNLSWSSHSFPSILKTSSIIPIHKMGKPLDSPASFRPISLTSCVSKLFERIILYRLLFFLESNSILSPRQAGFRPGRSTLDQILYLSQSISDGFNKFRPGSRTILSTIDFSKAFHSVWHSALFHKLISAGLPPCFARWTQSFLSDRRASVVFQNH